MHLLKPIDLVGKAVNLEEQVQLLDAEHHLLIARVHEGNQGCKPWSEGGWNETRGIKIWTC